MTEKQQRFIEAYMGEAAGNATEAARLAGYAGDENTLGVVGHENLKKTKIAAAIAVSRAELAKAARVDATYLIERFKLEAEGQGPDTNSAARTAALDKLAKHLGFYEQDNTQRAANIVVDLVKHDD